MIIQQLISLKRLGNHIAFLFLILSLLTSCGLSRSTTAKNADSQAVTEDDYRNSAVFIEAKRLFWKGDYEGALNAYNQIVKNNPKHFAAYYELSRLLQQKEPAKALEFGEKAYKLAPNNSWVMINLSQIYVENKQYKKSLDICEALVEKFPDDQINYYRLVNANLRTGNLAKSIKAYNLIESKFGENPDIALKRKDLYLKAGKPKEAIAEMEKLIQKYPQNERYYGVIADIYMRNGQTEKAIEFYNKVLEINPEDGKIHVVLASWYASQNQPERSYAETKKAMQSKGLDIDEKIEIMVNLYALLDKYPENEKLRSQSDTLLGMLVEANPNDPKALTMKADYLVRDSAYSEAVKLYRRVISIDSTRYPIWKQVVLLSRDLEDYKTMQSYARRAMELFPQQSEIYYFNGLSQYKLGNYQEAEASLNLGLSFVYKNEQKVEIYTLMGMIRDSLQRHPEAEVSFEKALMADPNNGQALNAYAKHLYHKKKDKDRAYSLAKNAVELNLRNANYIATLAEFYILDNQWKEAKYWIEKGLIVDSNNPEIIRLNNILKINDK